MPAPGTPADAQPQHTTDTDEPDDAGRDPRETDHAAGETSAQRNIDEEPAG